MEISQKIIKHYKQFSTFTYPGCYQEYLKKNLPDDIEDIGLLVRKNIIHRTTLAAGNTGSNADLRFGDMTKLPWWKQPEDDILLTASSMLAELFRRDKKGLTLKRKTENKIILTCRYTSILMASILKSKGIPCRVRAGHANYFDMGSLGKVSTDHWINQYWDKKQKRWVTIDVDGSLSIFDKSVDPYDIKNGQFDFPAQAWRDVRSGKIPAKHFYNAGHVFGMLPVLWSLFYDFHSLMSNEIHYNHGPKYSNPKVFENMTESELKEVDKLANLLLDPDKNFEKLTKIYNTKKEFRLLVGGLL
ncbi:transglutaminase domain-containing protein [Candidatus Nomurabacteria bacterium]|nr:transglutaminase domain-containing protein [Candidatus Nomurabacteria bacterium]